MKVALSFFVLSLLGSLAHGAKIKLCVKARENGIDKKLSGAKVKCWDEDIPGLDSPMTVTKTTGSSGCVTLSYTKKINTVNNPCAGWDCPGYPNPDIYCTVTKRNKFPVRTCCKIPPVIGSDHNVSHTRTHAHTHSLSLQLYTGTIGDSNQDSVANFGTVYIFPNREARGDPGAINGCGPASLWPGITDVASFLDDFADQCNNHNLCYNNCGETQVWCDEEFRDMMYSVCNDVGYSQSTKAACKSVADGMYALVRDHGSAAYVAAQAAYKCPEAK
jgi:hypothetical protein